MENYTINLRNIYRLLRANDYPVYSDSVIPSSGHKGLTLVNFWTHVLYYRWKNTLHGKMIWRTQGSKNRYSSEICNRKASFSFYQVYAGEITDALTPDEIQQQAELFSAFMTEKDCHQDILVKRLKEFISLAAEYDTVFCREAASYFLNAADNCDCLGISPILKNSWFLAMLTLHAVAGDFMNSAAFTSIRNDDRYLPEHLFKPESADSQTIIHNGSVNLTNKNCEVWQNVLPAESFFGREKESFDLMDAVSQDRKILISGIGGCGKTQLLRQLIKRITHSRTEINIASVQYEDSFQESFSRSFLNLQGSGNQERFNEAVHRLSLKSSQPVLLIIDNMNNPSEDPETLKKISSLPGPVLISSRLNSLEGFETYTVNEPDINACSLIFRNNYKHILSENEKNILQEFLVDSGLRHPLTLMLLGRSAGTTQVSAEDLLSRFRVSWFQLRGQNSELTSVKQSFRKIYKKLYSISGLSRKELKLLRVVSVLPYGSYPVQDLMNYTFKDEEDPEPLLAENLSFKGWLEYSDGLFSMHPVIAESIRKKNVQYNDYDQLWTCLTDKLGFSFSSLGSMDENSQSQADTAFTFLYALNLINSPISGELAISAGRCGLILSLSKYADLDFVLKSEQIINKCPDTDDELLCYIELLYLISDTPRIDKCEQLILRQHSDHTIPDDLYAVFHAMTAAGFNAVGRHDRVEQVYNEAVSDDLPEYIRYSLIATYASSLQLQVKREQAEQLLSGEIPGVDRSTGVGEYAGLMLNLQAGSNAVWMGKLEDARSILNNLDTYDGLYAENYQYKLTKLNLEADLALQEGDAEKTSSLYQESMDIIEIFSGKENLNYVIAASKLALQYNRMGDKWRSLSYQTYDQVISISEKLFQDDVNILVFLNNYAVALLDGKEPDKAILHLQRAYKAAEKAGPAAKAEVAYNLSKAYRQKGDAATELHFLNEAYPAFMQSYGPDHDKTLRADERLKELGKF